MKHKHHIIENRDGVRFRTSKTIELTIEEHANIHKKYYEKWGFMEDLIAYRRLSGQIPNELIQEELSRLGGLNNRGKSKSPHHRKKISEKRKNQNITTKTKIKISKSMKGNTNSKNHSLESYREKQSQIMKKYWEEKKLKKTLTRIG